MSRCARLGLADLLRLGSTGLRSRPLRVFLSALGVAIGVAAMIAVVGISVSSRAQVTPIPAVSRRNGFTAGGEARWRTAYTAKNTVGSVLSSGSKVDGCHCNTSTQHRSTSFQRRDRIAP